MQHEIFDIRTPKEFTDCAFRIFRYQFEYNSVYRSFCDLLCIHPSDIKEIADIPFLPIQFFKSHAVVSSQDTIQEIFTSSGTTGNNLSKHLVTDISWYKKSFLKGFEYFYGGIQDYTILALLPNYLERDGSSLIYMVNELILKTKNEKSGFYLNNTDDLIRNLTALDESGQKIILIGVSFALLDLVEKEQFNLKNTVVMETGGMKGRRREMTRIELHSILQKGFGISEIHSEYGMTELLSQGYSKGKGLFECPPWMHILIRDTEDALTLQKTSQTGGVNIIDLANYNSCSFIASQDLGKIHDKGQFEIMGRFDHSDIRGCNLLVL